MKPGAIQIDVAILRIFYRSHASRGNDKTECSPGSTGSADVLVGNKW
jgi:hypothetical protein